MSDSTRYRHIVVELRDHVLHVRLNRPEVHNALNGEMVEELASCFFSVHEGEAVRAVLLCGEGPSFCAGADVGWMKMVARFDYEANLRDARSLSDMLSALNACPVPTVARTHGAVLGGGMGLIACCDVVVAADDATFGFTEAKLGLLPAVISPFVLQKIGPGHARALFTTAQRFGAQRAQLIGLVHVVTPYKNLDDTTERQVQELLTSAPGAASEAKSLVERVSRTSVPAVYDYTVETNARMRETAEGREGISAFLEKRRPRWQDL